MALQVRVERTRCVGTKSCVNAAPASFSIDAVNVAVVTDPEGDPEDDVIRAAESCPTGAISVWRDAEQLA